MIKVIDLFSGVGGLSLGAAKAGFNIAGAIELDRIAIDTHAINFPNTKHLMFDISKLKGDYLLESINMDKGDIFGIIGGPPCQGFSHMGKQEIDDPRNSLFLHFFRLVSETNPSFFVAENVLGILDSKYDKIREKAFSKINKKFDVLPHIIINAKDVGAPTTRTRVFFIGINKKISSSLSSSPNFVISEPFKINKVADALLGLPPISYDQSNGWVEIEEPISGSYIDVLSGIIPEGIGNPEAIENWCVYNRINGLIGTKHTQEVIHRFSKVNPGEIDKISRAPRLKLDGFCPTLRAGTGRDRGSYQAVRPIHPNQHRVITPREAARLQGFPDWFQFHETKWHSFRQIGNSVSPIVSEYLFKRIFDYLTK